MSPKWSATDTAGVLGSVGNIEVRGAGENNLKDISLHIPRSAELLSHTVKNFVGESRIPHGASQYYATDHRRCPKDRFFPVPTSHGKNFLKSLLQRGVDFRRRASHLLGQRSHGAAVARIIPVPLAQVPVSKRSLALLAGAALHAP